MLLGHLHQVRTVNNPKIEEMHSITIITSACQHFEVDLIEPIYDIYQLNTMQDYITWMSKAIIEKKNRFSKKNL